MNLYNVGDFIPVLQNQISYPTYDNDRFAQTKHLFTVDETCNAHGVRYNYGFDNSFNKTHVNENSSSFSC